MKAFKRRLKTEVSRLLLFWTLWEIYRTATRSTGHQNLQRQIFWQNRFFTTRITRRKGGLPLYIREMRSSGYRYKRTNTHRRERITRDRYDVRRIWETIRHSDQKLRVPKKEPNLKRNWWRLYNKRRKKY